MGTTFSHRVLALSRRGSKKEILYNEKLFTLPLPELPVQLASSSVAEQMTRWVYRAGPMKVQNLANYHSEHSTSPRDIRIRNHSCVMHSP